MNIQEWLVTHQPKNGCLFTIAIDGRGGCGKSTLAELLKAKLPNFVILNGDDYFEPIDDPIVWAALRRAHPYEEPIVDIVPLINEEDL